MYPDQTPQHAASGLDLHCLPVSHKNDARLIWVNTIVMYVYHRITKEPAMNDHAGSL